MTERLLRRKAKRVLSCLDTELDKLKVKVQKLEARRDEWTRFEKDPVLSKLNSDVRKNDSYVHFYDEVKEIVNHAHLLDRADAERY